MHGAHIPPSEIPPKAQDVGARFIVPFGFNLAATTTHHRSQILAQRNNPATPKRGTMNRAPTNAGLAFRHYSLVSDAALSSILRCKDMLVAWATCIVAITRSGVCNSLIFGASCFLCASFFVRTMSISARIAGCTCRARISLRTCWSCWACHRGSRRGSSTPSHK